MTRWFDEALERIKKATGVRTQVELAELLGIRQSSISDAKKRNSIPADWFIKLYRSHGLNPDWLSQGIEPVYIKAGRHETPGAAETVAPYGRPVSRSRTVQIMSMPAAFAQQAHGQPSPTLGELSIPDAYYRQGLLVVRVDVTCMEPAIRKGAYAGIDQDCKTIHSGEIYGVQVPMEGLVLKRLYLDMENSRLILRSDNPTHMEQVVPIDDLDKQIVGKVIWVMQEL